MTVSKCVFIKDTIRENNSVQDMHNCFRAHIYEKNNRGEQFSIKHA